MQHPVFGSGLNARAELDDPACAPIRRTFALDDLTPLLDRSGVAQTVVVQAVDVAEEAAQAANV